MKKHNKDVLKATLFALIAIFIMIGAAGLLFAEHKKKIQKDVYKRQHIGRDFLLEVPARLVSFTRLFCAMHRSRKSQGW